MKQPKKNPHAVALAKARAASLTAQERSDIAAKAGKAGGEARASSMSKKERTESARKAANARWGSVKKKKSSTASAKYQSTSDFEFGRGRLEPNVNVFDELVSFGEYSL